MNSGREGPIVVEGAQRPVLAVQVEMDTRPHRAITVFPDSDELDGMNLSTHTDPPFNHLRATEEARKLGLVTHAFTTGYYCTDDAGKPCWGSRVTCSHPKCGYFDVDRGFDSLRGRWQDEPDCAKDVRCPLSATARRERARRHGR